MRLNIHFHEVFGKSEEEVWSLVKIIRVMLVVPNVLFEGFLQYFPYSVVKENNVVLELTIAYIPLRNLNDLIIVSKILCNVDTSKVAEENSDVFVLGYAHIKALLDCYYKYLAITDIDLSKAINKSSKVPQSLLKGKLNIDKFEDGEVIHTPFGVVFQERTRSAS